MFMNTQRVAIDNMHDIIMNHFKAVLTFYACMYFIYMHACTLFIACIHHIMFAYVIICRLYSLMPRVPLNPFASI